MKSKLATALRKVADKIDPPKAKPKEDYSLVPLKPVAIEDLGAPKSAIPMPDVAWNKSGWGNYV